MDAPEAAENHFREDELRNEPKPEDFDNRNEAGGIGMVEIFSDQWRSESEG